MKKMTKSFRNNKIGIILMICAALCTSLGQFFWKLSGATINIFLFAGFILYFSGALLMIVSFKFGSLSVLQPILSLGFVFGILFGILFLDEKVSINVIIGTVLILIGVCFIGGGED